MYFQSYPKSIISCQQIEIACRLRKGTILFHFSNSNSILHVSSYINLKGASWKESNVSVRSKQLQGVSLRDAGRHHVVQHAASVLLETGLRTGPAPHKSMVIYWNILEPKVNNHKVLSTWVTRNFMGRTPFFMGNLRVQVPIRLGYCNPKSTR